MKAVTHSGKFHADDVLAWALLLEFYPQELTLLRTRKEEYIQSADIVFDVGGEYNTAKKRFDHHQQSYRGEFSSAGMVLDWLHKEKFLPDLLRTELDDMIVSYVDDIDNGRIEPKSNVPCFASIVDSFNHGCKTLEDFDEGFHTAVNIARLLIQQQKTKLQQRKEGKRAVLEAMQQANRNESNILELKNYIPWKSIYFANGGKTHPTEFVIFPTLHNTWQAVAIPPEETSFAQKKSFPQAWAGLRDEQLSQVTGIKGSLFCHKNRFVAVFANREALFSAMSKFSLIAAID